MTSTVVTAESHPELHRAFVAIAVDKGDHLIGTVYPGEPTDLNRFEVPEAWAALIPAAETGLGRLHGLNEVPSQDWETFVSGDEDEAAAIRVRQGDLSEAHELLNGYFNHWEHDPPAPESYGPADDEFPQAPGEKENED